MKFGVITGKNDELGFLLDMKTENTFEMELETIVLRNTLVKLGVSAGNIDGLGFLINIKAKNTSRRNLRQ